MSPIQYSYAYYNAVDQNSDGVAQIGEILFNQGLQGYSGFDPTDPARLSTVNTVDPNVKAPLTHELLFGVDREIVPNFAVSATFTWRRMLDLLWDPLTGVRSSDYNAAGTLTENLGTFGTFTVPLYALRAAAVPAGRRPDRDQPRGLPSALLGPRVQRRQAAVEQVDGALRLLDQRLARVLRRRIGLDHRSDAERRRRRSRRRASSSARRSTAAWWCGGRPAAARATRILVAPKYQIVANGAYQGPWGLNFAGNLVTRQGYAEPFFRSNVVTGDPLGRKTVLLVDNVDDFRLPAVTSLDARIEKKFTFGKAAIALDFDVFNVLNSGTVLGNQYDSRLTGPTGFGQVLEIMNPRIARLGARFFF